MAEVKVRIKLVKIQVEYAYSTVSIHAAHHTARKRGPGYAGLCAHRIPQRADGYPVFAGTGCSTGDVLLNESSLMSRG